MYRVSTGVLRRVARGHAMAAGNECWSLDIGYEGVGINVHPSKLCIIVEWHSARSSSLIIGHGDFQGQETVHLGRSIPSFLMY